MNLFTWVKNNVKFYDKMERKINREVNYEDEKKARFIIKLVDHTKDEQSPRKTKGRSKDLNDSISDSSFQLSGSSSAKALDNNDYSYYECVKADIQSIFSSEVSFRI